MFGAWTNLTDMKAGNTLDTVVTENGRGVVRHYLQDVGSTFGTGALDVLGWADGWNYFYDGGVLVKRLVSLGFYLEPWQTASYTEYPSVGRFEGDSFDPLAWKPHAPTAAFLRARGDDTFWAARRIGAFSDDLIRAIVATGEFSDPAAANHLATVLMKRRDKILRAYLPAVNPLVDFALTDTALTFTNAAVAAHVADECAGYEATWARFDNATGEVSCDRRSDHRLGGPCRCPGRPSVHPGIVRQNPGARNPASHFGLVRPHRRVFQANHRRVDTRGPRPSAVVVGGLDTVVRLAHGRGTRRTAHGTHPRTVDAAPRTL